MGEGHTVLLQVRWKLSLDSLKLCPKRRQDVAWRNAIRGLGNIACQAFDYELNLDLGHQ